MRKLELTTAEPVTPEAKKLFDQVLTGEEFKALDVQLAQFRLRQTEFGRRELMVVTTKSKKTKVNFKTSKTLGDYLKKKRPDLADLQKNKTPRMRLALNMFLLRKKRGLTQIQAARLCGLGPATYQRYEEAQPTANPRQNKLVQIADAFGVDIRDLYNEVSI